MIYFLDTNMVAELTTKPKPDIPAVFPCRDPGDRRPNQNSGIGHAHSSLMRRSLRPVTNVGEKPQARLIRRTDQQRTIKQGVKFLAARLGQ